MKLLLVVVAVVAVAVYSVAWLAPSVGLYHDDAVYLNTARSLAAGHGYVIESLPTPIPQTKYPPLFPALLAVFVAISSNTQWLKLLPVACTAAWLAVTWRLLRKLGAGSGSALLLTGVTALSPAVVFVGTNLLSEPLFAFLTAAALLALLDDRPLAAGVFAGLAGLTRTAALPLIAACALAFLVRGRFRQTILFSAAVVLILGPWFAWSVTHDAHDPYYSGSNYAAANILTSLPATEKAAVIGANLLFLFATPAALLSGLNSFAATLLIFLITPVCFYIRRQFIPDVFLVLYCGMLLCWPGPPGRFLTPLMPSILWVYWRAFRKALPDKVLAGIGIVIILLPIWAQVRRLPVTLAAGEYPASEAPPNDWKEMNKLFAWIRATTPPESVIAANLDPLFYLNTGRKAVRGYVPDGYKTFYLAGGLTVTADQLRHALERNDVSYVALTPDRDFAESAAFHRAVETLERGGVLEPVPISGLAPGYRLLETSAARFDR